MNRRVGTYRGWEFRDTGMRLYCCRNYPSIGCDDASTHSLCHANSRIVWYRSSVLFWLPTRAQCMEQLVRFIDGFGENGMDPDLQHAIDITTIEREL